MLRPLSSVLALSLVLGAPGLPAYQAAAAVARPAAPSAAAVSAWGAATSGLLVRSAAMAENPLSPRLESILGHARLILERHPGQPQAAAAFAFVSHLPPAVAADPAAFSALEPAAQAALLETAAAAAAAEYAPRAAAFLAGTDEDALTAGQRRELAALEGAAIYLDDRTSVVIGGLAAWDRERRALNLGKRLARLLGRPVDDALGRDLADAASEVDFVLAGAARLAKENAAVLSRPGSSEARAFTRDVLAPYAARSLDRASARLGERMRRGATVHDIVLARHTSVFGGEPAKPALDALRPAGEWTAFVAAMSLHSARRLAERVSPESGDEDKALSVLKGAAADANLRLAIPSWHAEAASGAATVAELIASRHGATEPSFPEKGRLFTAFGIPVRADMGFYLFAGFMAMQLANNFFAKAANPLLLGAAAVFLLYVTLLGHEFGHALTARAFGVRTHGIALNLLGGAAYIEREPRRPLAEFLIAAAGPAVNFAIVAALWPLLGAMDPGGLRAVLGFTAFGNLLLGALNLLPAYPMDGGRLLRSGLAWLLKDHYKATRAAARVGKAFGLAGTFFGVYQLLGGDYSAVFTVMVGLFVLMGSAAAMRHPGTELLEPGATTPR